MNKEKDTVSIEDIKEKVIIVGVCLKSENEYDFKESMLELRELVAAADGEVIGEMIQNKENKDKRSYIGKGKLEELRDMVALLDADVVVFNDELSGVQLKNIEEVAQTKVIDRTGVVLDIFAKRATTKEGQLQVELAQLKYRLPRLIGLGVSLSRTGAGIGTRGPGETKLELNRRHILNRITELKKQLKDLEQNREVTRKKRLDSSIPILALVGYTNSGKSTLMNQLIELDEDFVEEKKVFVKDMLFATLDTTLRKSKLPNGKIILVSDTVGFVSKLPTHLVEAFKGTLEEVIYADIVLHVVDYKNKNRELQVATTNDVLKKLGCSEKETILIYNKIDGMDDNVSFLNQDDNSVYISALNGTNIDILMNLIEKKLDNNYHSVTMKIPYDKGSLLSYLHSNTDITSEEYVEDGMIIKTVLDDIEYNKYIEYII